MDWVVESQRLGLRPMTEDDFDSLCVFLQDAEVMAAWEHAFSDDEVRAWIAENRRRYAAGSPAIMSPWRRRPAGLWGPWGRLSRRSVTSATWASRIYWPRPTGARGLAAEGAGACMAYAFSSLGPAGSLRKSGRKTVDPAGWRNGWACR